MRARGSQPRCPLLRVGQVCVFVAGEGGTRGKGSDLCAEPLVQPPVLNRLLRHGVCIRLQCSGTADRVCPRRADRDTRSYGFDTADAERAAARAVAPIPRGMSARQKSRLGGRFGVGVRVTAGRMSVVEVRRCP